MSRVRSSGTGAARATGRATLLLAALAAAAWLTGRPFVFPSLGPSAYALAVTPDDETTRPTRVFGGHAVGVAAGLLAYHLFASGASMTAYPAATSTVGAGLAVSGVVALGLTTAGMLVTDLRHAPACATTLIVALGLLTTPAETASILLSVAGLLAVDRLLAHSSNGSSMS